MALRGEGNKFKLVSMSDQIKGALKGGSRDEATLELSQCNQKGMGEELLLLY